LRAHGDQPHRRLEDSPPASCGCGCPRCPATAAGDPHDLRPPARSAGQMAGCATAVSASAQARPGAARPPATSPQSVEQHHIARRPFKTPVSVEAHGPYCTAAPLTAKHERPGRLLPALATVDGGRDSPARTRQLLALRRVEATNRAMWVVRTPPTRVVPAPIPDALASSSRVTHASASARAGLCAACREHKRIGMADAFLAIRPGRARLLRPIDGGTSSPGEIRRRRRAHWCRRE
jgi:hypothetical protein